MPEADDIPATLKRSPAHAQHIYKAAHDSAVEQYGEGEQAHRTALAALKRKYEKVGDRWAPKKKPGTPSDPRSAQPSTAAKRAGRGETFGGVDFYGNTRDELYERARQLNIQGRSSMNKTELARAIGERQ